MKNKKGFTLVELLAVIVILAIILVIAVPKITETINSAKEASLKSSVQMVADSAETKYTVAQTLSDNSFDPEGDCMSWAGVNATDYASCVYSIDTTSGVATVTIVGEEDGKFDNWSGAAGKCVGTRTSVTCTPKS